MINPNKRINNIQGYDLYQIKKKRLSGDISKFLAVAYPVIVNKFLVSLSPLTKEEFKCTEVWSPYNQFVSG